MIDLASASQDACELCAPSSRLMPSGSRCAMCRLKGDLVGTVVWELVEATVRDAARSERVTFMLAGLPALFLEGIARQTPNQDGQQIEGRSLLLVQNPGAARSLRVLPPAMASEESAVHWRHSTAAEVIVFAPSDSEREGIGAGLGPLSRLDGQTIVDQISSWEKQLGETGTAEKYIESMLEGLRASQIYIDLEMWVDFIIALKAQQFEFPPHIRVQNAAPALRIPRDGLTKLPVFKEGGNPRARPQDFRAAFQVARAEVGVYAGLMTPKHEPVDTKAVREAVDTFDHQEDPETRAALGAVSALLDDAPNIRPGEWRASQHHFCNTVSWERIGSYLFSGGRKSTRKSLGEQTLVYIEGNYKQDVTPEDRAVLDTLKEATPKEPKDEELEFFTRWQERLSHPEAVKIMKGWQKRLFSKEVLGHDLLSAFSEGFEALIVAGADALIDMDDPRILVRTTQHDKAMFWEKLDSRVQKLFQFELKSVRGLMGEHVIWDLDACFEHQALESSGTIESRTIDLELYLVEASDVVDLANLKTLPKAAPRVKTTWQPGLKPKNEPIGLALPEDLSALATAARNDVGMIRQQAFAPRAGGDVTRIASTTLSDTNSFSDVTQAQDGRTFDTTVCPKQDILADLRTKIANLKESRSLDATAAEQLDAAVVAFRLAFRKAIISLSDDPETGFAGDAVVVLAKAFGLLCNAGRALATSQRARTEIRPLLAEIGIVLSSGSDPMAILAAWHPLRLAERRAKILDLAQFVKSVLTSRAAWNADLTIAFEERHALTHRWVFPEVAVLQGTIMISVEDVAGYSLLVPADCVARSQEALESSAPSAAAKFMEGVDQYLEVHPHEATNLSAAIFDSESLTLPKEISRLMAHRIHRDRDLRCDLVITHHEQARMRSIYRNQNMRLEAENISDTAKGFLSRLRVDVRPNRPEEGQEDAIREMDLVFLHDAVCRHAKTIWDLEPGRTGDLCETFDLSSVRRPRRRLAEVDAPGAGIYLSLSHPPRAVAEYQDLLYEMGKDAVLPDGYHGVLIRHVQFEDPRVREVIRRAHELGEWVVSYDRVSSRILLEKCGIQIIRDISVPGAEGCVIISACKIDDRLKTNVRRDLIETCGIAPEEAAILGDVVLNDVVQISGQKILSAARFANASREMIGLSVMRAHLEAALPADRSEAVRPIWISLDDYRGWFTSGKGKVADAVGVTVLDTSDGFGLLVQVGEAKFVSMGSLMVQAKDARQQVRETVDRLVRIFVDNEEPISRAAWCARLAELLVNRDGLSDRLPDPNRRAAFLDALGVGNVVFLISGEAIICLHDNHDAAARIEIDPERPHIRSHLLPTPVIRQTVQCTAAGQTLERAGLRDVRWYAGSVRGRKFRRQEGPLTEVATEPDHGTQATPESQGGATPDRDGAAMTQRTGLEAPSRPTHTEPGASVDPTAKDDGKLGASGPDGGPGRGPVGEDRSPSAVDADDRPRFIPPPIYATLRRIAGRERGTMADPASIAWAEQVCQDTQRALSHFGMQASFADPRYRLTPNGALVTFCGHETLTVEKIERRAGELLTTHAIEVVDVRPGRGKISLFVKRDRRAKVPLATTWLGAPWPDRAPGEMTNLIVGAREDDEALLFLNISGSFADYEEHGPHTLIAGETGSGKGILTQGLLLQIIAFNDPEKAELILVDPKKGVDFGWLKGAPHMKGSIITEMDDAVRAFNDLVTEMDERYERLAEVGANNIARYNEMVSPEKRLSRIFLVHDEMGAWMAQEKDYQSVVLSAVANLGMKARAAGIHLVLITQRADADAVPTRLRDNMGNRLCLKVQNATGSRMVLGMGGAEKLLGKGHLACVLANQSPPAGQAFHVVQVPFADADDMQQLAQGAIAYWTGRAVTARPDGG